jgi:hypothetical protein
MFLLKRVGLLGDAPDERGDAWRVRLRARREKDIPLRGQIVRPRFTR